MAQTISTTWRPSGSAQSNAAARNLKATAPAISTANGVFRTITQITRRDGVWCNCGGTVYTVTIAHTDRLIDTSTNTIIKTSNTVNSVCKGTGPSSENYATTTFSNFTAEESQAVIKAWNAGTLQIKRTVSIVKYDNSGHGSPTFRSGKYNDDITITGTTAAYDPVLTLQSCALAAESILYAATGSDAPFIFTLTSSINGSAYWEGSTVYKRLEVTIENLSGGSAPVSGIAAAVQNGTTATTWTLTQANFTFTRANGGFSRGCRYRVTFTLWVGGSASNLSESASVGFEIDTASVPMHFNRYGNGVGIGMYSSVTDANADGVVDVGWAMNAHGGINGVTNYVEGEVATGGTWIDGKPIYRWVWKGSFTVTTTSKVVATLPDLPSQIVSFHAVYEDSTALRIVPAASTTTSTNNYGIACSINKTNGQILSNSGNAMTGTYMVLLIIEYTKA